MDKSWTSHPSHSSESAAGHDIKGNKTTASLHDNHSDGNTDDDISEQIPLHSETSNSSRSHPLKLSPYNESFVKEDVSVNGNHSVAHVMSENVDIERVNEAEGERSYGDSVYEHKKACVINESLTTACPAGEYSLENETATGAVDISEKLPVVDDGSESEKTREVGVLVSGSEEANESKMSWQESGNKSASQTRLQESEEEHESKVKWQEGEKGVETKTKWPASTKEVTSKTNLQESEKDESNTALQESESESEKECEGKTRLQESEKRDVSKTSFQESEEEGESKITLQESQKEGGLTMKMRLQESEKEHEAKTKWQELEKEDKSKTSWQEQEENKVICKSKKTDQTICDSKKADRVICDSASASSEEASALTAAPNSVNAIQTTKTISVRGGEIAATKELQVTTTDVMMSKDEMAELQDSPETFIERQVSQNEYVEKLVCDLVDEFVSQSITTVCGVVANRKQTVAQSNKVALSKPKRKSLSLSNQAVAGKTSPPPSPPSPAATARPAWEKPPVSGLNTQQQYFVEEMVASLVDDAVGNIVNINNRKLSAASPSASPGKKGKVSIDLGKVTTQRGSNFEPSSTLEEDLFVWTLSPESESSDDIGTVDVEDANKMENISRPHSPLPSHMKKVKIVSFFFL